MVAGELLIIGGHEDKRGRSVILERFVQSCGGRGCAIAVVEVASEEPRAVERAYRPILAELEAEPHFLSLPDRASAADDDAVRVISEAAGIFFSGGDQLRITSLLGGTPAGRAIRRRWEQGAVVAGTSAGASAMSSTMIVGGDGDATPTLNTIRMAPGLGLLQGVVVDQHFAQRGRIGRLLSAVAQNPDMLGLGLDENAAVVVHASGELEVIGSQTVTLLDGDGVTFTNASEQRGDQPLAITDVRLHILAAGCRFDLADRRVACSTEAGGL